MGDFHHAETILDNENTDYVPNRIFTEKKRNYELGIVDSKESRH